MSRPFAIENIGYRDYNIYTIISASVPIIIFFYLDTINCNPKALNNTLVEASMALEVISMITKMDSSFNAGEQNWNHDLEEKQHA
ncbi:uncharacterized protein FPRO_12677 [Fusarium proliferatum ET1]|uniref:Uncharacterized protein n=1 Tax=Fusarium proliferatum (strain ET1) TaxID=1227346 RepID=A0A1L7W620_FUSPR|nr:uncharacterized protein FPRO_12677 [Fusarium proliferatum ET1]CZR48067.1 uncharacterized protein FPRO_12677 [Fusarium proliferatum ET1]